MVPIGHCNSFGAWAKVRNFIAARGINKGVEPIKPTKDDEDKPHDTLSGWCFAVSGHRPDSYPGERECGGRATLV